jgi:hypothetical protein
VRLEMGFTISRIEKVNSDLTIEEINEDYHNGDCAILKPINKLEEIKDNLKYLVVDFGENLILIYP